MFVHVTKVLHCKCCLSFDLTLTSIELLAPSCLRKSGFVAFMRTLHHFRHELSQLMRQLILSLLPPSVTIFTPKIATPKNASLRCVALEWVDRVLCQNCHQIFLQCFSPQFLLVSVELTGLLRGLAGSHCLWKSATVRSLCFAFAVVGLECLHSVTA